MARTIFIGDVHGCVNELADLLAACGHTSSDSVVFVGDLVAKGPSSRQVLALVRSLGARSVRGNHDHAVLRWHDAHVRASAVGPVPKHLRLARELGDEDWAQLVALPYYLELPELSILVVHAGLVPGVPLAEQDPDQLMNMRTLRDDGTPSRRPDDGPLWGSRWPGPELVVFGHHALAGLQRHPRAVGLDTGCVYGGLLSAYVFPDDRVISVKAHEVYVPLADDAPIREGA